MSKEGNNGLKQTSTEEAEMDDLRLLNNVILQLLPELERLNETIESIIVELKHRLASNHGGESTELIGDDQWLDVP